MEFLADILLVVVRLIVASVMIYYGQQKIKDLHKNARVFEKMGFSPGMVWGTPVAFLEFFGGILIALGLLVPLIVVLYSVQMIVGTLWKAFRAKKPFSDYSYDLLVLAVMLSLFITGPGVISLQVFDFALLG